VLAVIVVGLPGIDERRCKRGDPVRPPRRFKPGGSGLYSRPVATLLETKADFSSPKRRRLQAPFGLSLSKLPTVKLIVDCFAIEARSGQARAHRRCARGLQRNTLRQQVRNSRAK
jgi:hypothetical protein